LKVGGNGGRVIVGTGAAVAGTRVEFVNVGKGRLGVAGVVLAFDTNTAIHMRVFVRLRRTERVDIAPEYPAVSVVASISFSRISLLDASFKYCYYKQHGSRQSIMATTCNLYTQPLRYSPNSWEDEM
jgi:hypothetical protein